MYYYYSSSILTFFSLYCILSIQSQRYLIENSLSFMVIEIITVVLYISSSVEMQNKSHLLNFRRRGSEMQFISFMWNPLKINVGCLNISLLNTLFLLGRLLIIAIPIITSKKLNIDTVISIMSYLNFSICFSFIVVHSRIQRSHITFVVLFH